MSSWLKRLVAVMFLLSLVAAPQQALYADENTPDTGTTTETQGEGEAGTDDSKDAGEDQSSDDQSGDDQAGDNQSGDNQTGDSDDETADTTPDEDGDEGDSTTPDDGGNEGNGTTPEEGDGETSGTTPEDGIREADDTKSEDGEEESDVTTSDEGDSMVAPLAIDGTVQFPSPVYDGAAGTITLSLTFDASFSAEASDTMQLTWYSGNLQMSPGTLPVDVAGVPGLQITSAGVGAATYTFNQDFVATEPVTISTVFDVVVDFEECETSYREYDQEEWLRWHFQVGVTAHYAETWAYGEVCPAAAQPFIDWVGLDPVYNSLGVEIASPQVVGPNSTITLTYPPNQVLVTPGTYDLYGWPSDGGSQLIIGSAVVTTGLITFTMFETDGDPEMDTWSFIEFPASLMIEGCDPNLGVYETGSDEINYLATPGGEFQDYFGGVLCNAEPSTKTGVWVSETEIEWTIDSGHVRGDGGIYDGISWNVPMSMDCGEDNANVSVEFHDGFGTESGEYRIYCYEDWLSVDFGGDEIHRITVTFRTTIDPNNPRASYTNCAEVYGYGEGEIALAKAADSSGLGSVACYELFREGGGDFITKTVDKSEVKSGEKVTYTVEVSTSSDQWGSIDLVDSLPAGFTLDPASVTCSVVPVAHQNDPCAVIANGEITVNASAVEIEEEGWVSEPVTITLSFSGTLTGDAGSVITNEACSERNPFYPESDQGPRILAVGGDLTIPGGGVICDTASVSIISDPLPTATGTVSPTATVAPDGTPTVDPGGTPTTADPGETPTASVDPVTGLPETGTDGGGITSAFFTMIIAASILLTAAVGIRMKTHE